MEGAIDSATSQSTVTNVVDREACDALFEGAASMPLLSDPGEDTVQEMAIQGVQAADPATLAALGVLCGGYWFEQYSEPKTRRRSLWTKRL